MVSFSLTILLNMLQWDRAMQLGIGEMRNKTHLAVIQLLKQIPFECR